MNKIPLTTVVLWLAPAFAGASTLQGPVYPPPGGVTLGASGSSGLSGGKTFSYSNFDPSQYGVLYWGPTSLLIGEPNNTEFDMTFNSCSNSTCEFDAPVGWYLPTRLILNVSGFLGAPVTEASQGVFAAPTYPLFQVNGNFSTTFEFEALQNGSWVPIDTIPNESLGTPAGNTNVKSANFGFFDTLPTPEPASMVLIGAGLVCMGVIRRRKA